MTGGPAYPHPIPRPPSTAAVTVPPTLALTLRTKTYPAGGGGHLVDGAKFQGTGPQGQLWDGAPAITWDDATKSIVFNDDGLYSINAVGRFTNMAAAGYVELFLADFVTPDGWLLCEEFEQAAFPNVPIIPRIECRPKMPARFVGAGQSCQWYTVNGTGSAGYDFSLDFTVQQVVAL